MIEGLYRRGEFPIGLIFLLNELDAVGVLLVDVLGHELVLGEGLRGRIINFNFILAVEDVKVGAVGQIFTLDLLEEEPAVLHGPEEAP